MGGRCNKCLEWMNCIPSQNEHDGSTGVNPFQQKRVKVDLIQTNYQDKLEKQESQQSLPVQQAKDLMALDEENYGKHLSTKESLQASRNQQLQFNNDFVEDYSESEVFKSKAQACILGAFIGDAAGAYLEFRDKLTQQDVNNALALEGGGCFNVGKAQVTDDSEMAMCLFQGLLNGKGILDLDEIGHMYRKWLSSHPFDIGFTTKQALTAYRGGRQMSITLNIFNQVQLLNKNSQSNGCLMRITPLAVWGSKLSNQELYTAVHLQTYFTHSNKIAIDSSYLYCLAIKMILNGETNRMKIYQDIKQEAYNMGMESIIQWFEELDMNILPAANHQIGWLKIAFLYSFYYLKEGKSYQEALSNMLLQGGDTDTNAAIVCGLIGALNRKEELNQEYVSKLLSFRCSTKEDQTIYGGRHRPDYLIPGLVLTDNNLQEFFDSIPEKLEIKLNGKILNNDELDALLNYQCKMFVC